MHFRHDVMMMLYMLLTQFNIFQKKICGTGFFSPNELQDAISKLRTASYFAFYFLIAII